MTVPPSSSSCYWLILPRDRDVVLGRIEGETIRYHIVSPNEETSLADAIADFFLEREEARGRPVLMAVRSLDVLAVPLPVEENAPADKGQRQAMIYELEEYVPLSAEEFTADVLLHADHRLAVVLEQAPFATLLAGLERRDVLVQNLVPLAALVAQYHAETRGSDESGPAEPETLSWTWDPDSPWNEERREVFRISPEGKPTSWQLESAEMEVPSSLSCPYDTAIARQAVLILTGKKTPWWELRRDALAIRSGHRILRRPIRMLLWGAVALLLAFCLSCFIRGYRYHRIESDYRARQQAAFQEALPSQHLTTGFRNRLESEYTKLSAQREVGAGLPEKRSVLLPLQHLLASLPKETRYRFPEIRLESGTIRLDGQLQAHGDAELIARALQEGGFTVDPPSTQQSADSGVTVRLTLAWNPQGNPKEKKP